MSPPVPSVAALSETDRVQAAEYVLGTLDPDERERVRARMAVDPAFAGAVRLWERRLSPLHELAVPVPPPVTVWPAVAADLRAVRRAGRQAPVPGSAGSGPIGGVTRPSTAGAPRAARPAERGGGGPVAALRRLFGLGVPSPPRKARPGAAGKPGGRQKRPPAPAPSGPVVPPALRMPGAARLGDAIDDAVAAGLLPPAKGAPGSAAPGSAASKPPASGSPSIAPPASGFVAPASALAGPAKPGPSTAFTAISTEPTPAAAAPAPTRPRPPPEPLTPPPAFIFLEPEPPAESPAEAPAPAEADSAAAPASAVAAASQPAESASLPTAGGAIAPHPAAPGSLSPGSAAPAYGASTSADASPVAAAGGETAARAGGATDTAASAPSGPASEPTPRASTDGLEAPHAAVASPLFQGAAPERPAPGGPDQGGAGAPGAPPAFAWIDAPAPDALPPSAPEAEIAPPTVFGSGQAIGEGAEPAVPPSLPPGPDAVAVASAPFGSSLEAASSSGHEPDGTPPSAEPGSALPGSAPVAAAPDTPFASDPGVLPLPGAEGEGFAPPTGEPHIPAAGPPDAIAAPGTQGVAVAAPAGGPLEGAAGITVLAGAGAHDGLADGPGAEEMAEPAPDAASAPGEGGAVQDAPALGTGSPAAEGRGADVPPPADGAGVEPVGMSRPEPAAPAPGSAQGDSSTAAARTEVGTPAVPLGPAPTGPLPVPPERAPALAVPETEPTSQPAAGIVAPTSVPAAATAAGLPRTGAGVEAETAAAPALEPPSADPAAAQRGEEAAPLPRWAEAVASGAVSALPETAAEPPAAIPPRAVRAGLAWRGAALVLGVIALGLGAFVIYREWFWPRDGQWVGVLQGEAMPAIAVRIDPDSGVVVVRSFAPAPAEGEVNRLWVAVPGRGAHLIGAFSSGFSVRVPELAALGRGRLGAAELIVTRGSASAPPQVPQAGDEGNVVYRGRLAPE